MNEPQPPRFYFALPRLLALFRHGDTRRAETNAVEAWAGSIAIFGVSYLFFAGLIFDRIAGWPAIAAAAVLPFLVLLFWLLCLFLNSLTLKALRVCGLFRTLPARRAQAVLIGIEATALAFPLLQRGSLSGEIAAIWLVGVAMNLAAAVILTLRDGNAVRS